ncbi:MAG: hypothetical protein KC535_01055 [Nanoarchaeota archaeon]|nr:hypothetical protein [Nanoarchaeota archaeon]
MKVAPLSKGFMIASIIGVLLSTMFLPQYSPTWAVTLGVISFVMLIASIISMTHAPVEEELALDSGAYRIVQPHNEDITFFGKKTTLKEHVKKKPRKK